MAEISLPAQIRCVEREIRMRLQIYPRWVAARRMKQVDMDYEIGAMRAVLATLKAQDAGGQRSLFQEGGHA